MDCEVEWTMKTCIEAVRQYFDARTENWVQCNIDLFADVSLNEQTSKWLQRAVRQAKRKQRAYAAQGKQLRRAHTKIDIYQLDVSDDKKTVQLVALEKICWTYVDKRSPDVECRLVYHRQTWRYLDKRWVLYKAEETSDGRSFMTENQEAQVVDPLKVPIPSYRDRAYDRLRATRYADLWWDQFNPRYPKLTDDCTNFISQCLHAGGLPMTKVGDRANGWWVHQKRASSGGWSYSWATSNALFKYLRKQVGAKLVASAGELKMGDLIFYDWDGSGVYHHSTIVTEFDDAGEPLVNAHTDPSFHRPYTYYDSRAWTERTKYAFVHIP